MWTGFAIEGWHEWCVLIMTLTHFCLDMGDLFTDTFSIKRLLVSFVLDYFLQFSCRLST